MNFSIKPAIKLASGSIMLLTLSCASGEANTNTKNNCTAKLKHNAPEEFFSYYKREKALLTPEDLVTFYSRTFMDDGQLYYEGPRYSFIAEKHLKNISEGCKTLPMHKGGS